MTREQIEIEIQNHVDGARRIVEAGFDMVEISGIVGYLISNFISSYTNHRTDEYGGDVVGRAKFMTDIVRGIRKEVGPDVPIIIRLCGDELLHDRGGNTPEESLEVIKLAEQAGIDCLSVTAGWQESAETVISRDRPQGHWLYIAEKMKKNLKVPVAMAYRLFQPEIPDKAIGDGILDFWESCRAMIADPFLPLKIMEDRQEDIIPCMACNICLARLFRDAELNCFVRPSLGHEREHAFGFYGFDKAEKKKKIVFVGAGIASLQAAGIAAEKGHEVTIYEKNDHVGGQLAAAANGPGGDDEFMRLVNYLKTKCEKNGATFVLGKEITKAEIEKLDADEVIVGTGALPRREYPGADRPNVVSCLDVMNRKVAVGRRVVILGNKGVGISVALFLINEGGHEVTLVGRGSKVGTDVNPSYIWRYRMKLKEGKAVLVTKADVKEIVEAGVVVRSPDGETTIEADTVILAEMEENNSLSRARKGAQTIGDALLVRRGNSAILDGYRMGMKL
jgi:2,4-dienoyl-CoA reductase (NADPH2)